MRQGRAVSPAEATSVYTGLTPSTMVTEPRPAAAWSSIEADDEALFVALRSQDERAARLICLKFASIVRRYVARVLGAQGDIEDIVQEVFLNFFRDVRKVRDPKKLRYFLMGVAVNVARVELRRRRVRALVRLSPTGAVPEPAATRDEPSTSATVGRFYSLLDRLSARDRSIFILRFVEEMEAEEIALTIGSSVATVRRRIKHASERVVQWARKDPDLIDWAGGHLASR